MARVEKLQIIRTPHASLTARIAERFGLGDMMPDSSRPQKPEVIALIDRPKRPWYQLRRWRATRADVRELTQVITPHLDGTALRKDTPFHRGDFVVLRERPIGTRVHAKHLHHWEERVEKRLKRTVKIEGRMTDRQVTLAASHALNQEQRQYEARVKLNKVEAIHPRAMGSALHKPLLFALRVLRPGKSQASLEKGIKDAFRRLEDGIADPFNVIHGIAESAIQIQRDVASRSFGSLVLNGIFAASPRLNNFINKDLENLNKWTSRDTFRSKLKVAIYSELYTRIINHRFFNPKTEKTATQIRGLVSRVLVQKLLPSPTDYDEALDRQTTRRDLVTLHSIQTLLTTYSPTSDIGRKHQLDIATATISALTQTRDISDAVALQIGRTVSGFDRKTSDLAKSLMDKIPNRFKQFIKGIVDLENLVGRPDATANGAKRMAEDLVHSSKSMLEYYRRLYSSADEMMAIKGLKPLDILKIQQAKDLAADVIATYEAAQRLSATNKNSRRLPLAA